MPLSFASLRRGNGCAKRSTPEKEAHSVTKQASGKGDANDDVGGDAKLASSKSSSSSSSRDNASAAAALITNPDLLLSTDQEEEDDVIPFLRAHVSKYATRDNWLGAKVSAVTLAYFVLSALAPWLLGPRLRAAADALALSPRARWVNAVLLWAAWGVLRAAAYVRSFMLVRQKKRVQREFRKREREREGRERERGAKRSRLRKRVS